MRKGIYFGLSEAEYFDYPALSSTGLRQLLNSPVEFWINEIAEDRKQTPSMLEGKLFHKLVLDPASFGDDFVIAPDVNKNTNVYKAWKADQTRQIINNDDFQKVSVFAECMRADGQLGWLFKGGAPEVSIFWQYRGHQMKSRIDYLTINRIIDLKTMGEEIGKDVDYTCARYFFKNRVYLQLVLYQMAVKYAFENFKDSDIFGNAEQKKLWSQIVENGEPNLICAFMNRKMPICRIKAFTEKACETLFRLAHREIDKAIDIFEQYDGQRDIWLEDMTEKEMLFRDGDFPEIYNLIIGD